MNQASVFSDNVKIIFFVNMFTKNVIAIAFAIILFQIILTQHVYAMTQFYFEIPNVIEDKEGIIFSVNVDDETFSWIDNGTNVIPANNTPNTLADDTNIDLDANEYLLAIDKNIDIGTRVYMCVDLPRYFTEHTCETDAIDKNHLARASFQFLFR